MASSPILEEGYLYVNKPSYGSFDAWRKRWFVLKSRALYYFVDEKDDEPQAIIPLFGLVVNFTSLSSAAGAADTKPPERQGSMSRLMSMASLDKSCRRIHLVLDVHEMVLDCGSDILALRWATSLRGAIDALAKEGEAGREDREKIRLRSSVGELARGRCSWCFRESFHGRIRNNLVRRDAFACTNCHKRTLGCRYVGCKAFARGHMYWDDELCAVHDGSIPGWELVPQVTALDGSIDVGRNVRWCSWCMDLSLHRLWKTHFVKRDVYKCDGCLHFTVPCTECAEAHACGRSLLNDRHCAKCSGQVKEWERKDDNEQIASVSCGGRDEKYESFTIEREGINCVPLIDAKDTFAAMASAMEGAKHDIYIAFWLMCPVIHLRRTGERREEDRLDYLLRKKAEEGIHIHVLLWDELKLAFGNDSRGNKEFLEGLHENIKVVRHPRFTPMIFSHHQKFVVVDQRIAFVGGIDLAMGRYDTAAHTMVDEEGSTWWGVDYYNPFVTPSEDYTIETAEEDFIDRLVHPRMPWHDVEVCIDGMAARDVAANFIQRWNHHSDTEYEDIKLRSLTEDNSNDVNDGGTGSCRCLVVRSISEWSGSQRTECSILGAYISAINSSDFFVYIENQFFISSYGGFGIVNDLAAAIHRRIIRAVKENTTFRCIVVFPQPEEVGIRSLPILQREYRTISCGGSSLLERIASDIEQLRESGELGEDRGPIHIDDYITFHQLRSHGKFSSGKYTTNQIFCHSKMMVVDDRVAIVGSNNLNDRSLLGDRDTELAVVITDDDEIQSAMDGRPYAVGRVPHTLRLALMNEHVGRDANDDRLADPCGEANYRDTWLGVSKANTDIYEEVFPYIPSNRYRTWDEFSSAQPTGDGKEASEVTEGKRDIGETDALLDGIKGHLMFHPLRFLDGEPLSMLEMLPSSTFQ